jgi:hypothetical protein
MIWKRRRKKTALCIDGQGKKGVNKYTRTKPTPRLIDPWTIHNSSVIGNNNRRKKEYLTMTRGLN